MSRDFRHISMVGLLMWSLMHAWFGHDLVHGHHHQNLDEAAYSTAAPRSDTDVLSQLGPAALLVGFCDFAMAKPTETLEALTFEVASFSDPPSLEKIHSPRAPPSYSFSV